MYLYVLNGIAWELIPDEDPALPGIPLVQRYAPDFLKNIYKVPDGIDVKIGYVVDLNTWEFFEPPTITYNQPEEPSLEELDINQLKRTAIDQTRDWVEKELDKGMLYPVDASEGEECKKYNVTREKRADLTSTLLIGKMSEENGTPDDQNILRWNVSGEVHEDWLYKDLCVLAYTMYVYVTPIIEKQQHAEVMINEAVSNEEIIEILKTFS